MSYLIFAMAEAFGLAFFWAASKGIIGLAPAFLAMLVMLANAYHVLVRKPGGSGIRMASFVAALCYFAILSGKLFFEFRGMGITFGALTAMLITSAAAGIGIVALIREPVMGDYDD